MKSKESSGKSSVSAAKKGVIALLFAVMISAALLTVTYMPWKSFRELEQSCTVPTTGLVVEEGSQEKDGIYYYGPKIEYTIPGTMKTCRVKMTNTVNLNKTWKKGDALGMYFNEADPSQAIIRDEHTAENHFLTARIVSIVLIAAGFAATIVGCIVTFRKAKPKKFETNIAGQSFEEWQARQIKEQEDGIPEADMTITEDLSGAPGENQTEHMESADADEN